MADARATAPGYPPDALLRSTPVTRTSGVLLLPPNAASGKARASFANGVLTVEMPKKAGARSGRLVVK